MGIRSGITGMAPASGWSVAPTFPAKAECGTSALPASRSLPPHPGSQLDSTRLDREAAQPGNSDQ